MKELARLDEKYTRTWATNNYRYHNLVHDLKNNTRYEKKSMARSVIDSDRANLIPLRRHLVYVLSSEYKSFYRMDRILSTN